MEEQYVADRARLRDLLRGQPTWTQAQLAAATGRSVGWVKKWRRRLRLAAPDDEAVLWGHSRARHHPPPATHPAVVAAILRIRDDPPEHLRRVPGPRAILYYLARDPELAEQGPPLPRSTRTVWRILRRHGRIARPASHPHEPLERPDPLTVWQLDFKDASTVPADPEGKRQHVVEVLNTVDAGTSILLEAQVQADFTAETTLASVADLLRQHGLPERVTLDRDPRFVGHAHKQDLPAPLVRFLRCLGVAVQINPPRRPDLNAFVERYHRTFAYECLRVERPNDTDQVRTVTAAFKQHYNFERPNQALSCGNRPPRVACPHLPARPSVPLLVDPDAWVRDLDGHHFVRKVQPGGLILIDNERYYVPTALRGQQVVVHIEGRTREVVVYHRQAEVKRLPLQGLYQTILPFEEYVERMCAEARSKHRLYLQDLYWRRLRSW